MKGFVWDIEYSSFLQKQRKKQVRLKSVQNEKIKKLIKTCNSRLYWDTPKLKLNLQISIHSSLSNVDLVLKM